jgi:hypothetical protein
MNFLNEHTSMYSGHKIIDLDRGGTIQAYSCQSKILRAIKVQLNKPRVGSVQVPGKIKKRVNQ